MKFYHILPRTTANSKKKRKFGSVGRCTDISDIHRPCQVSCQTPKSLPWLASKQYDVFILAKSCPIQCFYNHWFQGKHTSGCLTENPETVSASYPKTLHPEGKHCAQSVSQQHSYWGIKGLGTAVWLVFFICWQ